MNAFEALRDHCLHSQQTRTFCGPIPRAPGSILLPGDHHQWQAFFLIPHRSLIDAQTVATRLMDRHTPFNTRHHKVLDPDVGKRSSDHHLMIAATGTVAVEVCDVYAL